MNHETRAGRGRAAKTCLTTALGLALALGTALALGGAGLAAGISVGALLAHVPEPHLVPREVGRAVGNVANDRPELVEPVD